MVNLIANGMSETAIPYNKASNLLIWSDYTKNLSQMLIICIRLGFLYILFIKPINKIQKENLLICAKL